MRQGVDDEPPTARSYGARGTTEKPATEFASEKQVAAIFGKSKTLGWDADTLTAYITEKAGKEVHPDQLTPKSASALLDALEKLIRTAEALPSEPAPAVSADDPEIPF